MAGKWAESAPKQIHAAEGMYVIHLVVHGVFNSEPFNLTEVDNTQIER